MMRVTPALKLALVNGENRDNRFFIPTVKSVLGEVIAGQVRFNAVYLARYESAGYIRYELRFLNCGTVVATAEFPLGDNIEQISGLLAVTIET